MERRGNNPGTRGLYRNCVPRCPGLHDVGVTPDLPARWLDHQGLPERREARERDELGEGRRINGQVRVGKVSVIDVLSFVVLS